MNRQEQQLRKERIIKHATDNPGVTQLELAERHKVSQGYVSRILIAADVKRNPKGVVAGSTRRGVVRQHSLDFDNLKYVADEYEEGASMQKLQIKYQCGPHTIQRILDFWDVGKREPGRPTKRRQKSGDTYSTDDPFAGLPNP